MVALGLAAFALVGGLIVHYLGLPQKWATGTGATVIAFGLIIYGCRRIVNRWEFWVALSLCFLIHSAVVLLVLGVILGSTSRINMLLLCPFMLLESFVLLLAVAKIYRILTHGTETVKISF